MADIASSLLLEERVRAQAAAFMPDVEVSTLLPATGRLDRHASLASSRQSTPNTTEEVASSAPPTVQRGRLDRHASMDDDAVPLAAMSALGRSAARKMQNLWVPYLGRPLDPESDQQLAALLDM